MPQREIRYGIIISDAEAFVKTHFYVQNAVPQAD